MLNDPIQEKMPALINYVQAGIDYYGILKNGGSWGSAITGGGGHPHGRKLPIAFAAVMLNNQEMKDAVHNAGDNIFGENDGVKYSEKAGTVLYAEIECSELVYWKKLANELGIGPAASGSKTCKDPYGYIDGGAIPGALYLGCCVSQNWKASSIAVRLIPELRAVWNDEEFHDFSDRYADFGRWTQPDPCAPITGDCNVTKVPCTSANEKQVCRSDEHCETKTFDTDYGVKYGPDKTKPGECIKDTDPSDGIGRLPQAHGTNKNEGGWGSRFANAMWDAYRIYETGCGNGLIDTGESCSNCPQDVKCGAGQKCCNGICTRAACTSNSDCNAGQQCINAGQCDANCQNTECSQGAITNACYCQGQARTTGYCCSDSYQTTPCTQCIEDSQCSAGQKCCDGVCITPACLSNTQCNDNNSETVDSCENPASCESYCKNEPLTCGGIVCIAGQICCNETCRTPACTKTSDCDDSDACTRDGCTTAGTCTAQCSNTAIPKCGWKKMSWTIPSCFPIAALFTVTVKDETGTALEGVEITYGTQKMFTNTEGKVEMLGEKAKYVINAAKEGHYPLTARKLASTTCKPIYTTTGTTPTPAAKGKIKIEVLETPYINKQFAIKITDNNNQAVQGATIAYSQQTAETNEQGQATLTAEKSKYIITATTADGSTTARILPKTQPSGTSDQNKDGNGATAGLPIIPLDIIALIAIIIIGAAALLKARKQKEN
jgi:hypothetical protein